MKHILFLSLLCFSLIIPAKVSAQTNCMMLEEIFETKVEEEKGICKVEIVRKNLNVSHMGIKLSPETMGLLFHLGFENIDGKTAVMGEMPLMEDEVNAVVDELRKGKIEVSAIHNHMINEEPRVLYLHFQGMGDLRQQAGIIKRAIAATGHKFN
ncbi:hypothetical protein CVD28_25095 [Bacillus sp. M6-12]|uniref:DUF1259 domain-containing protein n=1 Tax=Bacillus sp. M6-12 TaxID=2054166 RepID=UPI000C7853F8|nr:DUF1259 domain-containing protein [Bacillus sp. M6-12]PLS14999.1 hypothetical protein CVD28_25095 [Bacillus sp. M6-12]